MQRVQGLVQSLGLRVSALLQQEAAPACRWLSSAAVEAASSAPEGVSILPRHQALKRALKPQASCCRRRCRPPPLPPPLPSLARPGSSLCLKSPPAFLLPDVFHGTAELWPQRLPPQLG